MYFTYEQPSFDSNDPAEIRRVIYEAYVNGRESARSGKVADYIPELAKADAAEFGLCVRDMTGETITHGETEKRFSIQSISKVINLAAALKFLGFRETFSHVGLEPTGDAFNSILKLDTVKDITLGSPKVGDKIAAVAAAYYACPIVVVDVNDPNEDASADGVSEEESALAIYMKREAQVETDRDILRKTTVISADEHYTVVLANESKVVLAKFKA